MDLNALGDESIRIYETCPDCDGTGRSEVALLGCAQCRGTGSITTHISLSVLAEWLQRPAGVEPPTIQEEADLFQVADAFPGRK